MIIGYNTAAPHEYFPENVFSWITLLVWEGGGGGELYLIFQEAVFSFVARHDFPLPKQPLAVWPLSWFKVEGGGWVGGAVG